MNSKAQDKTPDRKKIAVYFTEEERANLDRWYNAAGCQSRTEFITEAMRFYIDYLKAGDANVILPIAVGSAIDGKLGSFERQLAALLFKQSVELDMLMRIIAENNDWKQAEIEDLRRACERDVSRTHGTISFEEIIVEAGRQNGK